jgi:hypothetical protein
MKENTKETNRKAPDSESEGQTSPPSAGQTDLVAGLAGTTSRIVSKAASLLEEEIALGIRVTQDFEEKYVDTEQVRSKDAQGIIQRFRRDAHDVVDVLIDLVSVAADTVTGLTERGISIGIGDKPRKPEKKEAAAVTPSLTYPSPVKPGDQVEIPMTLENESDKSTEAFSLHSSDLVNATGERISSKQISFSPEQLVIEPQQASVVTVTIRVPENAAPGVYSGLLQATYVDQLRAVLSIQII